MPYGAVTTIDTPDAAAIRKVALIKLGAVTHSTDMDQRYVPLPFTTQAGSVTATGPANANIAPPGPYMLVVVDAAGVPSVAKMVSVSAAAPPPPVAPTVSITQPSAGASFTAPATVSIAANAADADGSIAKVEFFNGTTRLGEDTTAPYTYSWTGVAQGSYSLTAKATDNSASSTTSAAVSITVGAAPPPPPPPPGGGLVGAWGFGEASGTTVADSSGRANTGTLGGATRTTSGKFGGALSFDGVNDWVTVADSASLDLSTRGTLEAWIAPTVTSGWRTALMKERSGGLAYALYAHTPSNAPNSEVATTTAEESITATAPLALNTWTHLAVTWDGTTQRLYLNGVLNASRTLSGTLINTTGALRFGGNGVWGEWFSGRLDEIRICNRALTASEIQTDMTTPVATAAFGT